MTSGSTASARDAKALLLSARKPQSAFFQTIFQFIPDGCLPQRSFHDLVQRRLFFHAVRLGAVGDVVVHAHGKRVGFLEHHAHALAKIVDVHFPVQIFAVDQHFSVNFAVGHEVVHAVERFQKGGFSASRRTDERGDLLFFDVHINIFQRMKIAVI